eukprot:1209370-Pyramimonas_sp.AAC.1
MQHCGCASVPSHDGVENSVNRLVYDTDLTYHAQLYYDTIITSVTQRRGNIMDASGCCEHDINTRALPQQ